MTTIVTNKKALHCHLINTFSGTGKKLERRQQLREQETETETPEGPRSQSVQSV